MNKAAIKISVDSFIASSFNAVVKFCDAKIAFFLKHQHKKNVFFILSYKKNVKRKPADFGGLPLCSYLTMTFLPSLI